MQAARTVTELSSFRIKYPLVGLMCLSVAPLLAMPSLRGLGWVLLGLATVGFIFYIHTLFGKHMLILAAMLALLGLTPINTSISWGHLLGMGAIMTTAVAVPFFISRRILKEKLITFPFRFGRRWYRREIGYVLFTAAASYLILPYYLGQGSYHNWSVELDVSHIIRLFIGTNALGIWDELFFIGTALALLRAHLPFWAANLAQTILFTTFLYELGFQGWGPFAIFFFALSQGYIFSKSKSFLYILTIHLTIDFVLFLTLIHLHHPQYLRIFLTSPF